MKKIKSKIAIASVLCISFFFGSMQCEMALANENPQETILISALVDSKSLGEKIVDNALALETAHPSRGSGTQGERETAETLATMLEENGFEKFGSSYIQEFLYTPLMDTSGTTTVTDQHKTSMNVIGKINNNQEQTIIIGAHYDNFAKQGEENGTGFYSNLLGVSAALETVCQLSEIQDLEYNIVIAFWGGEEDGLHGSEYFVSSLTNEELSRIALYVNLDSIGVGDELNIFTNEIPQSHEDVFLEEAKKLGYELQTAPRYKGYTLALLPQRPFMHLGIMSANYYFMTSEVPCSNFFSYVWESEYSSESRNNPNILFTKNDNSQYIFDTYGREVIESRMQESVEIVLATLTRDDIVSVLQESKATSAVHESFYDDSLTTILGVCLVGAFAIIAFAVIKKLSKEVKLPQEEEKPLANIKVENVEVFGETVVLHDGVMRKKPNQDGGFGENSDGGNHPPQNPFEF